jgi:hypothetical protein
MWKIGVDTRTVICFLGAYVEQKTVMCFFLKLLLTAPVTCYGTILGNMSIVYSHGTNRCTT